MSGREEARQEHIESQLLVKAAFEMARTLEIDKLVVQADQLRDVRIVERYRQDERVIWLSGTTELPVADARDRLLHLPEEPLSLTGELKLGLLLAVLNGYVARDERLLFLSGAAGSERLDTLLIVNPQRDFPWLKQHRIEEQNILISDRVLVRVLGVALRLAAEGREGHPIGTLFVIGKSNELEPHLHQLVLNPCAGHPQRDRNIFDPDLFETLREFAALDGAIVVDPRGVVQSAATYIDAPINKRAKLYRGQGARHAAGAKITAEVDALAVVISSSSGTVTVFHNGHALFAFPRTSLATF